MSDALALVHLRMHRIASQMASGVLPLIFNGDAVVDDIFGDGKRGNQRPALAGKRQREGKLTMTRCWLQRQWVQLADHAVVSIGVVVVPGPAQLGHEERKVLFLATIVQQIYISIA